MKQARSFSFVAVLAVLAYGLWVFDRSPPSARTETPPVRQILKASSSIGVTASTAPSKQISMTPEVWRPAIAEEFERARELDDDPAASERRLDQISRILTVTETERLAALVKAPKSDGDERAVAVDLLARAGSPEAAQALASIALSPVPSSNESRLSEFERALRGRAVEGLGHHPSPEADGLLKQVANRTSDSFLLDRARRALAYRQRQAPSPEDQDREALRRLTQ